MSKRTLYVTVLASAILFLTGSLVAQTPPEPQPQGDAAARIDEGQASGKVGTPHPPLTKSVLAVAGAADISAGTFGANTGGGTYAFPGSVGIGTSTPATALHVLGALKIDSNSLGRAAQINANLSGQNQLSSLGDGANGYYPFTVRATQLKFTTSTGAVGLVQDDSGNVGFGTTTPAWRVHVFNGALVQETNQNDSNAWGLTLRKARGVAGAPALALQEDNTGFVQFQGYDGGTYAQTAIIRSRVEGDPAAGSMPGYLFFGTTPAGSGTAVERMRITSSGNVGIGTSTPTRKLEVVGDAYFSGTVRGGNIVAKYQDVAEWVPAAEELAAGTVVVIDPARSNAVVASTSAYDTSVAGVVSPNPGIVLGEGAPDKAQVATTGRVRVWADATSHPIALGDLLVTSAHRGTVMRSEPMTINGRTFHQPGTIVGKALEPLPSGRGQILVLLSLQ